MVRVAVALLLLMFASSAAMAEKRIALLIGNKDYKPGVGALVNPLNDIRMVGDALKAVGFEVLRPTQNATRTIMLLAVHDFAAKLSAAGADAVGFLYYSGHGIASAGENYLVPIDIDEPSTRLLSVQGVKHSEVLAILRSEAPNAAHYLVLDACRNTLQGARGGKGFVPVGQQSGVLVAFAAEPGKTASDTGAGSGPYAAALAAELVKPGQNDLLMFHRVRVAVMDKTNGDQVPWTEDGIQRRERVLFGGDGKVSAASDEVAALRDQLIKLQEELRRQQETGVGNAVQMGTLKEELAKSKGELSRREEELNKQLATAKPPDPKPPPAASPVVAVSPIVAVKKRYDDGATDTEIRIGNTNPYSGNASAYGVMGKTIEAYFKMVNEQGGINGRKINFITYDDGYAPPKTVEMVRKLVEEDKVLFVFQTLGTPPNTAIHKYLNQKQVPHLFVATGASKWGNPKEFPWTMGWQPDYVTEAIIYAKHILANVKNPKIAVLMQNDDYGKDHFNGFKQGLGKDANKIVQVATYEVTDPTVDSQMIQLKNSGATVFFNITTPKFAAQAIKKAAEIGWRPVHYLNSVSASVGAVMKPAGIENAQSIITAAYIKQPTDPQWARSPDMMAWNQFMDKYLPHGDKKISFYAYGYAVTATLVEVLKRCGDNLTRENIMKQAASLKDLEVPLLLPGIKINTGPNDFFPIQSVRLQRFNGDTFELFGEVLSNESSP